MKTDKFYKKALFLDRDGIINEDFGYVYESNKFKLVDGIIELIAYFTSIVDHIIVISNQSGIGRGFYTHRDWENFNKQIEKVLMSRSLKIDAFYCCPHLPKSLTGEECICRKPNPGMLLLAKNDFSINLKKSILVGDKISDIQAAHCAGLLKAYLLTKKKIKSNKFDDFNFRIVKSLKEIIKIENINLIG